MSEEKVSLLKEAETQEAQQNLDRKLLKDWWVPNSAMQQEAESLVKRTNGNWELLKQRLLGYKNVQVLKGLLVTLSKIYKENDSLYKNYLMALRELFQEEVVDKGKALQQINDQKAADEKQSIVSSYSAINRVVLTALLSTDVDIAIEITTSYPEYFFLVDESLLRPVYRALVSEPQLSQQQIEVRAVSQSAKMEEVKDEKETKQAATIEETLNAAAKARGEKLEAKGGTEERKATIAKIKNAIAERNRSVEHKTYAVAIIDAYLATTSHQYKREFFSALKGKIEKDGIAIETLQAALSEADRNQLFANRSGPLASAAAKCLRRLYDLASLGPGMSDVEYANLVSLEQKQIVGFPSLDKLINSTLDDASARKPFISDNGVRRIINHLVVRELQAVDTCQQESARLKRERVEAIYQQYLYRKALDTLDGTSNPIFDTQGRVYITVKLTSEDYADIVHTVDPKGFEEEKNRGKKTYTYQDLMRLAGFRADNNPEIKGEQKSASKPPEFGNEAFCSIDISVATSLLTSDNAYSYSANSTIGTLYQKWLASLYSSPLSSQYEDAQLGDHQALLESKEDASSRVTGACRALMELPSRDSIIPLQLEIFDHARVMWNGLRQCMPKVDAKLEQKIVAQVEREINKAVQRVFKDALLKCYNPSGFHARDKINIAKLNILLDTERESLAIVARRTLIATTVEEFEAVGDEQLLKEFNAVLSSLDKESFSQNPATTADIFSTCNSSGTCCRVTGTDQTAHGKKMGASNQALRFVHYNKFNFNNENGLAVAIPLGSARIQARVPSIAPFDSKDRYPVNNSGNGRVTDAQMVIDVRNKISYSVARFNCAGPCIYQLLTSFAGRGRSLLPGQHKQTKSAEIILRAAHEFNAQQINSTNGGNLFLPFCIPINEHTAQVKRDSVYSVIKEAALMAELSLFSVLNQNAHHLPLSLRGYIHAWYTDFRSNYAEFLQGKRENNWTYFQDSPMGEKVNAGLTAFHERFANGLSFAASSSSSSLPEMITKALLKIFTSDQYKEEEYGRLVQTFVAFLAQNSQKGCKSANERWLAVAGRVEVLTRIDHKCPNGLSMEEGAASQLRQALESFITSTTTDPGQLNGALDQLYNEQTICSPLHAVCTQDQGAGPKVARLEWPWPKNVGEQVLLVASMLVGIGLIFYGLYALIVRAITNNAESSRVTNLSTEQTSAMQAHTIDFASEWHDGASEYRKSPLYEKTKAEGILSQQFEGNSLLMNASHSIPVSQTNNGTVTMDFPSLLSNPEPNSVPVAVSAPSDTGPLSQLYDSEQQTYNSLQPEGTLARRVQSKQH